MGVQIEARLVEEALACWPPPVADALGHVAAAEGVHERRDRVVECFRALVRCWAALALAVRIERGPGPDESREVTRLLAVLGRRALTDGQWLALARELCRGWRRRGSHPVPELVALFARRSRVPGLCDALLAMRRCETVAHGGTGDAGDLEAVLQRRIPQLEALLVASAPLWRAVRLVVADEPRGGRQRARLLAGDTPAHGTWRRIELPRPLAPGRVSAVDPAGRLRLRLWPLAVWSGGRLMLLDRLELRVAVFASLPLMDERGEAEPLAALRSLLGDGDAPPPVLPARRGRTLGERAGQIGFLALLLMVGFLSAFAWHQRQLAVRAAARAAAPPPAEHCPP